MHNAHATPHSSHAQPGAPTRGWIIKAFNHLVLRRRFESLSVRELARRAGVGRSTFYEHFRSKDEVLRHALAPVLRPLANAAVGGGNPNQLSALLTHINDNRARTLELLAHGPTREHIEQALADLILPRLIDQGHPQSSTLPLLAARLAGSQVAALFAWLRQDATVRSPAQAAEILSTPCPEPLAL